MVAESDDKCPYQRHAEEKRPREDGDRVTSHQLRNSWGYQKLEEAKIDSCLAETLLWDSGLQKGDRTGFCCMKPSSLWPFLTAATGK